MTFLSKFQALLETVLPKLDENTRVRAGSMSKYFDSAACESLRVHADGAGNVASAIRLMMAGALLSGNEKVVAELNSMAEALDQIKREVLRSADDLDPRLREEREQPRQSSPD